MKASIVVGVCRRYDAISDSIMATRTVLEQRIGAAVRIFAYDCEYADVDWKPSAGVRDVIFDRHFIESDIIIYHFGIFYEMFSSILIGNGRAKQIVRFHNVTPREFVSPAQISVINRSMDQVFCIESADEIWCDSEYNRETLSELGVMHNNVHVIPLFSDPIYNVRSAGDKHMERIELLYVGRFVQSKGVVDLIQAVSKMCASGAMGFRLRLVGNIEASDPKYVDRIQKLISDGGLSGVVEFVGTATKEELAMYYGQAHIFVMPSYHEGFCVPVLDAMAAKAIPVVCSSGNLPDLIGQCGQVVPPGDVAAMATTLLKIIQTLAAAKHGISADFDLVRGSLGRPQLDDLMEDQVRKHSRQLFDARTATAISRSLDRLPAVA